MRPTNCNFATALTEQGASLDLARDRHGRKCLHFYPTAGLDTSLSANASNFTRRRQSGNRVAVVVDKSAACARQPTSKLEILLDFGADMDAVDSNGWNALQIASMSGDTDAVAVLFRRGLTANARDTRDRTALHIRAQFLCNTTEIGLIYRYKHRRSRFAELPERRLNVTMHRFLVCYGSDRILPP